MEIIKAEKKHIGAISVLLRQVLNIHNQIRPDIFKKDAKKYTRKESDKIIFENKSPIFICVDGDKILGYCFCIIEKVKNRNFLQDNKTLYIDDLCVDENYRGKGIGKMLYNYVLEYAKSNDCFNVTLGVWTGNESAKGFYESLGFKPQKTYMEVIIKE
jgi:ribosomal protein S18 acetylase RimI-like enzyme